MNRAHCHQQTYSQTGTKEHQTTRSLHHNPTTVIGRCTKDLTQDPTPLCRFYQTS